MSGLNWICQILVHGIPNLLLFSPAMPAKLPLPVSNKSINTSLSSKDWVHSMVLAKKLQYGSYRFSYVKKI